MNGKRGGGQVSYCLQATPFGTLGIVWSPDGDGPRVLRTVLPAPRASAEKAIGALFPEAVRASCSKVARLADQMAALLEGQDVWFSLDAVRMDLCSAFQRKVLRAEHAIPRGRVSTYRLIAAHLGNPNAARAVGRALATNPFPIIVPCHRAVRSDGGLGGYQGGFKMKRALLEMEGVLFRDARHVATTDFFYAGRAAERVR